MSSNSEPQLANRQPEIPLVVALWLFAIFYSPASLPAAEPPRPIRESITLPVNGQAAKTLLSVDEYLADKRYAELTELLTKLIETHRQDVVAISRGSARGVNRYVNVARHCQGLLAALPPEGLAASRQLLDPPARRWYESWKSSRDEAHLERILRSAYVSSYGDNALWDLGETAWDRGDFALARFYWRQLMKPEPGAADVDQLAYPDPEFPVAEVEARLFLCDLFDQRPQDAEQKLLQFQERRETAVGTLAGRSGRLVEILDGVVAASRSWPVEETFRDVNTFGGSSMRQRHWPNTLDVGPLHWSAQWPVRNLPQPGRISLWDRGPLKSMPIIDGCRVFLCDGDAIRGWRVLTGEPAWPNEQADASIIYPQGAGGSVPAGRGATPDSGLPEISSLDDRVPLPDRPCVGVPWQTLTIHRGKLLARLGSPVVGAARTELRDLSHEIVCLDIGDGEGKLVWKLTNQDIPSDGPAWSFEGTPLVVDDAAFVVIFRRQPEPEFALLSLDVETGTVNWLRPIGSARPVFEEAVNRVSHLLLTAGEGRLYLSTDEGAIVCLSPHDGSVQWAVTYESESVEFHHSAPAHLQTGLLPPLFWHGLLFVAPNDSRQLFCLDARTGRVLWQRESRDRVRQLIGVVQSSNRKRLITAGNSLVAYDVDTGDPGWRLTQSEPARQGYGEAVLSGSSLYWPTREVLFQVDPATGDLQREILLHTPDSARSGGNLAVAGGILVVVEPNAISAYFEYGRLKERVKIDLSQRPRDAELWRRLMEVELGGDNWDAALSAGRRAWTFHANAPAPLAQQMLRQWKTLLRRVAARKAAADELVAADAAYSELAALSLSPEEQGRMLWDWSQLDLQRGRISAAIDRLHQILALDDLSMVKIEQRPIDQAVHQQLKNVLEQHGRESFEEIDQQGEKELAAALSAGEPPAIRQVLRKYPLLGSGLQTWSQLVDAEINAQEWSRLWPLFADWERETPDGEERRRILEKKAAAFAVAGYHRSAERLRHRFVDQEAVSSDAAGQPEGNYLAKAWEFAIAHGRLALAPHGVPPDDSLACVLLAGSELEAIDRQRGTRRWRQNLNSPPQWAAYGETDLLIGDGKTLSSRSLETGELIWQQAWTIPEGAFSSENQPIHASPDRIVVLYPGRNVTALSTTNGSVLWEFHPRRGKLQPQWRCNDEQVVLQTLEPSEMWILNAATGEILQSGTGTQHGWRRAPTPLDGNRWALVTKDRQVAGWEPGQKNGWKYRGGMSHAHTDPWLMSEGGRLGLLVDGTTLVGLDPQSGSRLWATGLADQPLTRPEQQTTVFNQVVVGVSDSTIRAVSLNRGQRLWEDAHLSPADWSIQRGKNAIVVSAPQTATTNEAELWMFRWFDGQRWQLLRHPGSPHGRWHVDDHNVIWMSPESLTAWNPVPRVSPQQAARSR